MRAQGASAPIKSKANLGRRAPGGRLSKQTQSRLPRAGRGPRDGRRGGQFCKTKPICAGLAAGHGLLPRPSPLRQSCETKPNLGAPAVSGGRRRGTRARCAKQTQFPVGPVGTGPRARGAIVRNKPNLLPPGGIGGASPTLRGLNCAKQSQSGGAADRAKQSQFRRADRPGPIMRNKAKLGQAGTSGGTGRGPCLLCRAMPRHEIRQFHDFQCGNKRWGAFRPGGKAVTACFAPTSSQSYNCASLVIASA
jgi:hypothetical protein